MSGRPADVATRLAALRESIAIAERVRFQVLREACGVFSAAVRRLRTIAPEPEAPDASAAPRVRSLGRGLHKDVHEDSRERGLIESALAAENRPVMLPTQPRRSP